MKVPQNDRLLFIGEIKQKETKITIILLLVLSFNIPSIITAIQLVTVLDLKYLRNRFAFDPSPSFGPICAHGKPGRYQTSV